MKLVFALFDSLNRRSLEPYGARTIATYFRYPDDMASQEIFQYTLMPTHISSFFTPQELATATLAPAFGFTKGAPVLKVSGYAKSPMYRGMGMSFFQDTETVLFDTLEDPD